MLRVLDFTHQDRVDSRRNGAAANVLRLFTMAMVRFNTPSVEFVVGNTYARLSHRSAPRVGRIHDWTLYVDILDGDIDLIQHVEFVMGESFTPRNFVHHCPVPVYGMDGRKRWRFASRQQSLRGVDCEINIKGCGGSNLNVFYTVRTRAFEERRARRFVETRPYKNLGPVEIPDRKFGLELELSTANWEPTEIVAAALERTANKRVDVMTNDYRASRQSYEDWKLVHDGSIACHRNRPDCNAFELVAPILRGPNGLRQCETMLHALSRVHSIKVNKSMGFHVHINVQNAGLVNLKKICQNFIKYERAMDTIMPQSRRVNQYCKSNKAVIPGRTNEQRHEQIDACQTVKELCYLMNPGPGHRYYKLNLDNLRTNRMQTLEFRQHSATSSPEKILAWIRFCLHFVSNSIRLKAPSNLKDSRTVDEEFDMLFQYVIKDRYLQRFYRNRREELSRLSDVAAAIGHGHEDQDACCNGCDDGQSCELPPVKRNRRIHLHGFIQN